MIATCVQSILCIPNLVRCCNLPLAARIQRQETWVYCREETEDLEGNGDHLPPSSPCNGAESHPAVSLITFHALLLLYYCPTIFILSSSNILVSQWFHIYSPNDLNASFSTFHLASEVDYVNLVKWESYFPELSSLNSSKLEANKEYLAWNLKGRRRATDKLCSHSVDTKKLCASAAVVHTGVCSSADSSW